MNDKYRVILHTPAGIQRGVLSLSEKNGSLSGSIRALGRTSTFKGGKAERNRFRFSGVLHFGLFRMEYTVKGSIKGKILRGTAMTKSGAYRLEGEKIS